MQLEIEIEAIKREQDELKLKSLNADLANLKEERNEILLNGKVKNRLWMKYRRLRKQSNTTD